MRIVKLLDHKLENAVATVFENNKNHKLYFNLEHGNNIVKNVSHVYRISISTNFIKPEKTTDKYELKEDTFCITPLKIKGVNIKTRNGYQIYILKQTTGNMSDSDMLVFWHISNKKFLKGEINYSVEGDVSVIGEGAYASERGDNIFYMPAPVLEIYGNCTLKWEGIESNTRRKYGQIITYNFIDDKFDFKPLQ